MPLKVGMARAAAATGTPNFTQDFTDSGAGFSTDVKAAIFISGNTTADHTTTAGKQFQFAFAANNDGTAATSTVGVDGATPASNVGFSARYHNDVTAASGGYAYAVPPTSYGSSGEFQAPVDFAAVSNGVRVTWTDQSNSELIYALLLGGDIEASVVHAKFSANTSVNVSHGLSAAPEVIIALYGAAASAASNVLYQTIGMWDGTTQQCIEWNGSIAGNSSQARVDTNNIITKRTAGNTQDFTLSAVGSTQFTLGASVSTSDYVSFLCLRGTTSPIVGKCGIYDCPTGTGNAAMGLGLGVAPQVLLALQSVMTASDSGTSDDTTDVSGAIAAINQAGTTKYGGVTGFIDDAAATTVAKTQTTNSQAIRLWDTTPAIDVEATVATWDAGDITLNFSNVGASAFKIPYLAFGVAAAGGNAARASFHRMIRNA